MFSLHSLGAEAGFGPGPAFPFQHGDLPFRRAPRYLRLVDTINRALDYATGGFHVSVDRGTAGGCIDDWAIHAGGTKPVACTQPRNRDDIRQLWGKAAEKYKEAFNVGRAIGTNVSTVKEILAQANLLADQAYAAEGIEPPRDPVTGTVEPPVKRSWLKPLGIAGAAFAGIGLLAFGLKKADQKHNPKKAKALSKRSDAWRHM